MSLTGVFTRFAIFYLLAAIIIGFIVEYFKLPGNSAMGMILLFALTMSIAASYGKKNSRYFDRAERRKVIAGISLICIAYQGMFFLLSDKHLEISTGAILLIFGVVALLILAFTAAGVDAAGKALVKQGVLAEYPQGSGGKSTHKIRNPFLRSFLKILLVTVFSIIVLIIAIPLLGELTK